MLKFYIREEENTTSRISSSYSDTNDFISTNWNMFIFL